MADLRAALVDAVGAEHVSGDGVPGAEHVSGDVAVAPGSTEEVAAVLRVATEHGATVLPVGSGRTVGWLPGPRVDVELHTGRLDRVLEHSAGDLVVHVQAGALLTDIQQAVSEAGQRLALSSPVQGVTIGGLLAADLSGPARYLYGTTRDLVIGTTSVRADGTVTHSGGKVVKNVAGYDLGKLYTGSRGTLGVITDAWFRLHPLPESTRWVLAQVGNAAAVGHVVSDVRNSQTAPTAIEVGRGVTGGLTVAVQLDGVSAGIDVRADAVARMTGGAVTDIQPSGWGTWPDDEVLLALSYSPASLPAVLDAVGDVALTGSAGVGVLRVGASSAQAAGVLSAARAVCAAHHGTATVLRAPADHGLDVWGPQDPALLALMRRVKDEFDPAHTLAPGRAVGGI